MMSGSSGETDSEVLAARGSMLLPAPRMVLLVVPLLLLNRAAFYWGVGRDITARTSKRQGYCHVLLLLLLLPLHLLPPRLLQLPPLWLPLPLLVQGLRSWQW